MCTKHCKNQHETMICVEPSHAQHLIQNIKNNPKIIPKSSKKCVRRPSKNASENHLQKNTTKINKKSIKFRDNFCIDFLG